MKDEFELQITYQNDFVDWLSEMNMNVSNIQFIGAAHGDQTYYAIFTYTNNKNGNKEWGVYGGSDNTSPKECPILIAGRKTDSEDFLDILDDVRLELNNEWGVVVKEINE